jgi:hypothetical protein
MATIATYIKVRRRMYETVLAGAINTSARRVLLGSILVDSRLRGRTHLVRR